jgi:hypothetical protein
MTRQPLHPKLKAAKRGTGPHWLCYRCDLFVGEHRPCEHCQTSDLIGRCQPQFCSACQKDKQ